MQYYSHGKLLLTSEYVVLDGAKALALPTKLGQHLQVRDGSTGTIEWFAKLHDGSTWFTSSFILPLKNNTPSQNDFEARLLQILSSAQELNTEFLKDDRGYQVTTTLEFPRDWGLGSSSTLIANIAQWAAVNPYELLAKTFGGSGYDLASAVHETPIIYKRNKFIPEVTPVTYKPSYTASLHFIHLNKKQNSRDSIQHYRAFETSMLQEEVSYFSTLTEQILKADSLNIFINILEEHEERLSTILKTPTVKERLFKDYHGAIKSLGGWGGDFILATGTNSEMDYFRDKGFNTIISYKEMVLEF